MSNLINSIIEPVVRRFSQSSDPATPAAEQQSHARGSDRSDTPHLQSLHNESPATLGGSNNGPEQRHWIARSGFLNRFVSSTSVPEQQDIAEEETPSSPGDALAPSLSSLLTRQARDSPPEDMSGNPLYGVPERFRSMDTLASNASTRSSQTTNERHSRRNTARRSRSTSRDNPQAVLQMSSSLPEDDGMRWLRQKIHEIRDSEISGEEKAKRMHYIMTEEYRTLHPHSLRTHSPSSILSHERPFTPTSPPPLDSDAGSLSPTSTSSPTYNQNPYNISAEDAAPSYRPRAARQVSSEAIPSQQSSADEEDREESPSLGCEHYKRNVKIQCFDCRKWYTCRHCHDDVEDHALNRKKTQNMLCMICNTPQPAG
ncbi:hypothetical protein LTS18_012011, partial [Coniosporium uncinatum]